MTQTQHTFTARRTLRTATALVLIIASASAVAQSREYRRGYDEGYRDGQAAAQQGGFRPAPPDRGPRITITEARYGRGGRVCDARPAVQSIVDQQGETTFEVTNDLCGDPAKNQAKTLYVTFQCGRSNPVRTSADESQGLRIACR